MSRSAQNDGYAAQTNPTPNTTLTLTLTLTPTLTPTLWGALGLLSRPAGAVLSLRAILVDKNSGLVLVLDRSPNGTQTKTESSSPPSVGSRLHPEAPCTDRYHRTRKSTGMMQTNLLELTATSGTYTKAG